VPGNVLKILFVCAGGTVFGKEIITLSLMEGLRRRGHEVSCLTSTWGDHQFAARLEEQSIAHARLPLGFISKTMTRSSVRMTLHQLSKMPRLWLGYRRLLRRLAPDAVVHSNFHHLFILWPLLTRSRTFFHVHDPFPDTGFYRRLLGFLSRRLSAFIGVSRHVRDALVGLGLPEEKVFAVLNGITLNDARETGRGPGEPPSGAVNGVSSIVKRPRIGIVGQVAEWKGHDDFVAALDGLRQSGQEFSAVIFGAGAAHYLESLKQKIARYGLAGHVRWAGFVRERERIFTEMEICVVPSRSADPCPTVAIEAAHYGVPLIATRRGGLPELVKDGETGYLVDVSAPQQITDKLKALIHDERLYGRMAAESRRYARQHLTRERMAEEMENTLRLVLSRAGVRV
jgi:glycosyltransferase involved in cell wall biosynthesis